MFGRIRASPVSSLESFESSPPSKILKEDSFSIYEATLMKLKLGAKRDNFCMHMEDEDFRNDCSVTEEANMDVDSTPATASGGGKMTLMNTDSSSTITTFSDDVVSTENNSEQPRQNNASILRFFKMKDPGPDTSVSVKKGSYGSVSSSGSVESNCTTSELVE